MTEGLSDGGTTTDSGSVGSSVGMMEGATVGVEYGAMDGKSEDIGGEVGEDCGATGAAVGATVVAEVVVAGPFPECWDHTTNLSTVPAYIHSYIHILRPCYKHT
jgi:hypothetical protein